MTYATQDDLLARTSQDELLQLTDLSTPPAGIIDAMRVSEALMDADALINSFIGNRITVPLAQPVPRVIVNFACAIARYYLWKDRASEKVTADYQAALSWLKGYANGIGVLGDEGAAPAPDSGSVPQIAAPARVFTRDSMKGL